MTKKKNRRITINVSPGVSEIEALQAVGLVVNGGRVSDDGKSYCYVTRFARVIVEAAVTRAGNDTFWVLPRSI